MRAVVSLLLRLKLDLFGTIYLFFSIGSSISSCSSRLIIFSSQSSLPPGVFLDDSSMLIGRDLLAFLLYASFKEIEA